MAAPSTPYIGSKISLISKLDIRYEGILYTVDSRESTIALSKVRSFGTEDRPVQRVVPPQDDVYDYIIFKANDIKDLIVCETPKPPPAPGLVYDPAILSTSKPERPRSPAPAPAAVAPAPPVASAEVQSSSPRGNRRPRGNHNHHQRPRGGRNGPRGGGHRNNVLKFDSDYDFDKANEQFKETLNSVVQAMEASKLEDDLSGGDLEASPAKEEVFYDKSKSFFDMISCEALEKSEDKNTRPDWRKERLTNQETFGQQSIRSYGYRRGNPNHRYNNQRGGGGRGGYRGGNHNYRYNGHNNQRGGGGGGGYRGGQNR